MAMIPLPRWGRTEDWRMHQKKLTWFQTQLMLAECQIQCHSDLWDHCGIGLLGTLPPRGCLGHHMMPRVRQLILVWTRKSVAVSHCIPWFQTQIIVVASELVGGGAG